MSDDSTRPLAERRPDLAVAPGDLRFTCDETCFDFATTAEVHAPEGTVGQERAVEALELGLRLRSPGYHVFVSGPAGTGRSTAVRAILASIAPTLPVPPDRAYVQRFDQPDSPRLLTLPAGSGRRLTELLDEFRDELARRIPGLLEDRDLERQREAIGQRFAEEEQKLFAALTARVEGSGLTIVNVDAGGTVHPEIVPVDDGKPVALDAHLPTLSKAKQEALKKKLQAATTDLREHLRGSRDRQRAFLTEVRELLATSAGALVDDELREATELFADQESVQAFLGDVRTDAVAAVLEVAGGGPQVGERLVARLSLYRANLLADRTDLVGAPVVEERFPSRQNLVGSVERVQDGPLAWHADASTIRGGSLLRADGGFLVVQASDLLAEPGAWEALKRTIVNSLLEIGGASPGLLGLPRALEPDAVPVDVKVVLIGERWIHDRLYSLDPDFRKLFGVRADFASDMRRTPAALVRYAEVVSGIVNREQLPTVSADALGALVEEGAAMAERRDRLTARFSEVANLLREAAFHARQRGSETVEREDVTDAKRGRERRDGQIEERLEELLEEGVLLVATSGRAVGQVNGLSVYDLGYHAFGKPTRITASAAPGRAGIINVEREARLSGGIYDKGVLIISGYLRRRYADLGALTLTASLAFEQSYAGVDGDSASIAEVAALLSELSGLPVDQGLAITGSIDQHGAVQPVGGVMHKIRGFHALCRARGLDGSHGVVLPIQNVRDLMLPRDLVDDVAAGRLNVRAVSRVEDALEIALDATMETIDERVRARLSEFAKALSEQPGTGDVAPTSAAVEPPQTPLPESMPA